MMSKKKIWLIGGLFMVIICLLGTNQALGASNGQVQDQTIMAYDICGRELFNPDGTPRYYMDPCLAQDIVNNPNNVPSGLLVDRFELPYVAYTTGGSWVEGVSVDDFDKDGKLDMALSTSSYFDPERDHHVWLAKQNTATNFELIYSARVGATDPESMDVADMNGDGYLDIIVANAHGGARSIGDVEIFWGSDTTFTRADYLAGNTPYAVAIMPIGIKTLAAVTNWNDVILSAYLGGDGFAVTHTDYAAPRAGWNQLAIGDLNHDDNLDVVVMWGQTYAVPSLTVYYGDGLGGLSIGPNFPKDSENPSAITVGDVTHDGLDDVVIARGGNRPNAEILIYAQQPNGTLSLINTFASYDIPASLDVADVNCDGVNDLIATNSGWEAFSWWPGNRDGTLGAYRLETHSFYFSAIGPNGAEMADVNGDRLKDYVVVDYNSDGVLVALQKPCYKAIIIFVNSTPASPE
jgi:hypothetical protein